MHLLGNRTHALIGLWILLGLVVIGINGAMLMALWSEPLAGYSDQVRDAERALGQYRAAVTATLGATDEGMDALKARFTTAAVPEQSVVAPAAVPPVAKARTAPAAISLPVLEGVVTHREANGRTSCLALMDGRVWTEGERLRGLTVHRIDRRGVALSSGQRTFFLEAPAMTHSLTTTQ